MVPVDEDTQRLISCTFEPKDHALAEQIIAERLSDGLPLHQCESSEWLARIRRSAIKLSLGSLDRLNESAELAERDWRDLLMAAGFGQDVEADKKWSASVLKFGTET